MASFTLVTCSAAILEATTESLASSSDVTAELAIWLDVIELAVNCEAGIVPIRSAGTSPNANDSFEYGMLPASFAAGISPSVKDSFA